ncbi:Acyl-CoA thioesterase FadM [Halogranum amylolyticum]|uniref:Acyl-CoA thioesterase FadM n=1 Tax=Halogranum amylolyticum TaxID=660520 RepID=A0A1H8UA54_9EURY|nr:acyl-[acyl-carrier-protein] thioesterase [Halogranum amylolyticum]SEP00081.1 Acyl-CoA thioesterase FadM [Halogranum amylolyticum]
MQTIDTHNVRFGELAGPLVNGARFFDWELISTQVITEAFDHAFEDIVDVGGIPYAPVVAATTIHRYPGFRDIVTVETTPISVGKSSVELLYEMIDGDGDPLATARLTHVTIAPEGGAQPLPEETREAFRDALEDADPDVGPQESNAEGSWPSFTESFDIRGPHVEGSELAYFEEYPRFADVALERFLESKDTSLDTLNGDRQPFRLRNCRWEFVSPVQYESTLTVESDIRAATQNTLRIKHLFKSDNRVCIEGVTEYGSFDKSGAPTSFTPGMRALFTEG